MVRWFSSRAGLSAVGCARWLWFQSSPVLREEQESTRCEYVRVVCELSTWFRGSVAVSRGWQALPLPWCATSRFDSEPWKTWGSPRFGTSRREVTAPTLVRGAVEIPSLKNFCWYLQDSRSLQAKAA